MYNNRIVWIVVVAALLEVLCFIGAAVFYLQDPNANYFDFLQYVEIISVVCLIPFFIILLKYQFAQKRYLILSILSIVTLISYFVFFTQMHGQAYRTTIFADITLIGSVGALITAAYVGVDDGTYKNVKRIFISSSLWLIVFKTPLLYVLLVLISEMFRGVDSAFRMTYFVFFIIQFTISLIINIYKINIVNKIDFV